MPGFLSSLEAIGTGLGHGAEAIQQQQQAQAQLAMQRLALQQAQARQQSMAAMLPGLVAAYGGQGQQQPPPGPPAGFTGPGYTTPPPAAPQMPMMPPAAPSAAAAPPLPQGISAGSPLGDWVSTAPDQLTDYMIKREGPSAPGVVNNPGNIKFANLPGQTDSGVKARDGGTFASYATPDAGRAAILQLAQNAAAGRSKAYGQFPTSGSFINTYEGRGSGTPIGGGMTGAGQSAARGIAQSIPPETIAQGRQAAGQAAQEFNPMEYGRVEMQRAVEAIDKQDIPPEAKVMAIVQMAQILRPEDRMMMSMYMRSLTAQRPAGQPYELNGRWYQPNASGGAEALPAGAVPAGAARQEQQGWVVQQLPNGTLARVKLATGEVDPLDLPKGTIRQPTGQARSMPGMVMQKYTQDHPDATYEDLQNVASEYRRNQAIETSFGSGINGRNLISINTLADHIELLRQYGDALKNKDLNLANQIKDRMATQTGWPEVINYGLAGTITGDETIRLLTTTGGTQADREGIQKLLSPYNSPAQIQGAIDTLENYARSRYEPLRQEYARSDPAKEKYFNESMVTPEARKLFESPMKPPVTSVPTVSPEQYEKLPPGAQYKIPGSDQTFRKP